MESRTAASTCRTNQVPEQVRLERFCVSRRYLVQHLELINISSRKVFEALDFKLDTTPIASTSPGETSLSPPSIDPNTPEGKNTRAKLLRAWVEISTWLQLYHKALSECNVISSCAVCIRSFKPEDHSEFLPMSLHMTVESATDMYQTGIGAHISQRT